MMKIFDTHAHYDNELYDEDRSGLLPELHRQGLERVVNIGVDMQGSQRTVELAEQYDFVYGAVGVHPDHVKDMSSEDIDLLRSLAKHEKICAIGEIGLDYYHDKAEREVQLKWFAAQANLARELGLPIVIHSRDAAADTVNLMKELHAEEIGGVVHCYSYSRELAREFLNMGYYFGVGGVITYRNGRKLKEVVDYLPMEQIVLETDSPYLTPEPYRRTRNHSMNLELVVAQIAEIKGITRSQVAEITFANAKRLYRMD